MATRKTEQDYHDLAIRQNLEWLAPMPATVMKKTCWKCSQGHIFEMKYNHVDGGHGCKFCAGNIQKTPDDYKALAQINGLEWLGPEVSSVGVPTGWYCTCGTKWMARYSDIAKGKLCKTCGIKKRATTRRHPPEDYHKLAEQVGYKWLGPHVSRGSIKTWWECPKNHRIDMSYNHLSRGERCRICSKKSMADKLRRPPSDYYDLAKSRGYKWLGPEVKRVSTKTWWECPEGHRRHIAYISLASGNGCAVCSEVEPKTPDDYINLAHQCGFVWLGPMVQNVSIKTWWECPEGHKWDAPFTSIKSGRGCRFCAKQKRADSKRIKPESYTIIAQKFGIEWLGPEVKSTREKTFWKCKGGHRFDSTYSQIAQGVGCRYCARNARKEPEDYHILATQSGYQWLGPIVRKANQKTNWLCADGHTFSTTYDRINQGKGCIICNQSSGELKVSQVLNRLGIHYEYQKRFSECKNKRPLPFDFYFVLEGVEYLIEFDGELHTRKARFDLDEERLKRTQLHDSIKTKFAQDYGYILIRIPYNRKGYIEQIIKEATGMRQSCSPKPLPA